MTFDERIDSHLRRSPVVHPSAFIAASADLIGDITIGENASIWYRTVLRADINAIVIGANSNVQDGSVIHLADHFGVRVGEFVTIGHQAMIHACTIDDEVLIGMGAIILDGAEIGARSIIGAGALVTSGRKIPPGSMVLGSPGKVVRMLDLAEQNSVRNWAEKYVAVSRKYMARRSSENC